MVNFNIRPVQMLSDLSVPTEKLILACFEYFTQNKKNLQGRKTGNCQTPHEFYQCSNRKQEN